MWGEGTGFKQFDSVFPMQANCPRKRNSDNKSDPPSREKTDSYSSCCLRSQNYSLKKYHRLNQTLRGTVLNGNCMFECHRNLTSGNTANLETAHVQGPAHKDV